jgi:hypothetical protein
MHLCSDLSVWLSDEILFYPNDKDSEDRIRLWEPYEPVSQDKEFNLSTWEIIWLESEFNHINYVIYMFYIATEENITMISEEICDTFFFLQNIEKQQVL